VWLSNAPAGEVPLPTAVSDSQGSCPVPARGTRPASALSRSLGVFRARGRSDHPRIIGMSLESDLHSSLADSIICALQRAFLPASELS
jgi:hypothetical protein